MNIYENNLLKINPKFVKTENDKKSNEELNRNATKTYQGDSIFLERNTIRIYKKKKLKDKSKKILSNISKRLLKQNSLFVTGIDGETKIPLIKNDYKFHIPRIKLKTDINILTLSLVMKENKIISKFKFYFI